MKKTQILKVILAALVTSGSLTACDEYAENANHDDDFVKIDSENIEVVGFIPEDYETDESDDENKDDCEFSDPEDFVLMGDVPYLPEDEQAEDVDDNFVREDPVIDNDEEFLSTEGRIIVDSEYLERTAGMISVED